MNLVTQIRRALLLRWIDLRGTGLEIGPYDQPTVCKTEADIRYLDWQTREQLVAQCAHPELAGQIPETDYLVESDDYGRYVDRTFDYVIANHVLEHAPNLIRWLQTVGSLIVDGGLLFLALPDKRFTFDRFRPDTALSHFLAEYFADIRAIPVEHHIEVELYYDMGFVGRPMEVAERLDWARIQRAIAAGPHVGIHNHVFRSATVLDKVLRPLQYMGLIPFTLEEFVPARAETGGEMILVLRKAALGAPACPSDFFKDESAHEEHLLADNAQLVEQVQELRRQLAALQASKSWRITAPLRRLRQALG